MKMEERQLTKLASWFKNQHISCLRVLVKGLGYSSRWVQVKITINFFGGSVDFPDT